MSQHDLTIDNQGFPAFRADLNNALQALGSTQSGTTAPSPTFANQLWYDTTNNILKIRNEDNDAWISVVTLDQSGDLVSAITATTVNAGTLNATGVTTVQAGTVSLPAITTTGDTNTGIFFPAADTIAFTEGGAEAMRIDSSGNVGIGTASPTRRLQISASGSACGIRIDNTVSGRPMLLAYDDSQNLTLTNSSDTGYYAYVNGTGDGTERMRIDSSGNVLIGKTSATANGGDLQVSSGITFPATQVAKSDANTLDDYEEGTWTPVLAGSTTAGTYVYDTDRTGGQYTKIGRQVTIRGAFRVSSVTSAGTGDATITGVPFVHSNVAPSWTRTPGSLIQQSGATLATDSLFVGFGTTGSAVLTMSTQSTSTIAAISVTDADFVNSIYSFTFTYFTA